MDLSAAEAVLWCPSDGYMTPAAVTKAYESWCRRMGMRFEMGTAVTGIAVRKGRVVAVQTDRGEIRCRIVIDAAGAHAYHIARLVGLELPIIPVRHEYYDTAPLPGLHPDLPCFRIPEMTIYGRAIGESLRLGGWEATAISTDPRSYRLEEDLPTVETDREVLDGFEKRFTRIYPAAAGRGSDPHRQRLADIHARRPVRHR